MNKITELKQKRAAIVAKMREINERAEDGLLTAEDRSAYDQAKADFTAMSEAITRQEDLETTERMLAEAGGTTPEGQKPNTAYSSTRRWISKLSESAIQKYLKSPYKPTYS